MEPITCEPSAAEIMPAATAAADPLLDPPGLRPVSHGFSVPRGTVAANSVVTVFTDDDTACFAKRGHGGAVAPHSPAREQRRALLGRHVGDFHDVLHPDRHAVDRRMHAPRLPTGRRIIGGGAIVVEGRYHEGLDVRLALGQGFEAPFEKSAWRVAAVAERGGCLEKAASGRAI